MLQLADDGNKAVLNSRLVCPEHQPAHQPAVQSGWKGDWEAGVHNRSGQGVHGGTGAVEERAAERASNCDTNQEQLCLQASEQINTVRDIKCRVGRATGGRGDFTAGLL